jgi:hypothetical protein
MLLKYQEDYNALKEICPPKEYKAQYLENVFRWVFDDIADKRNFTSQFHRNPKRFQLKSDVEKCKALALSMFDNLEGSKERFAELKDHIGDKIYQTLGTKVATSFLTEEDGMNGEIERLGHFTHHSSEKADYTKTFIIVDTL